MWVWKRSAYGVLQGLLECVHACIVCSCMRVLVCVDQQLLVLRAEFYPYSPWSTMTRWTWSLCWRYCGWCFIVQICSSCVVSPDWTWLPLNSHCCRKKCLCCSWLLFYDVFSTGQKLCMASLDGLFCVAEVVDWRAGLILFSISRCTAMPMPNGAQTTDCMHIFLA